MAKRERRDMLKYLYNDNMVKAMESSKNVVTEVDNLFEKYGVAVESDDAAKTKTNVTDIAFTYYYRNDLLPYEALDELFLIIKKQIEHLNPK